MGTMRYFLILLLPISLILLLPISSFLPNLLKFSLRSKSKKLMLFVYQVFGAFWYLFSIERETTCWQKACRKTGCVSNSLYCDGDASLRDNRFLNVSCSLVEDNPPFDFGIFLDALKSGVVGSMNFPQKFFYCFWWGLRNLRYVHCLY